MSPVIPSPSHVDADMPLPNAGVQNKNNLLARLPQEEEVPKIEKNLEI